jgi:hypothetical protein
MPCLVTVPQGDVTMTHARSSCLDLIAALIAVIGAGATAGCNRSTAVLTELVEARRLASELHVQFTQAVDASNRAVMAENDDVSAGAAGEARRAREVVEHDVQKLRPMVESLGYRDDSKLLEEFNASFDEYRRLDDEILSLAIENTNLRAQRLSFGAARDAAAAFGTALNAAIKGNPSKDHCNVEAIAARARTGVLEIQVMQAPHIAEPEDAVMTRLESEMDASASAATKALDELRATLPPAATSQLDIAGAALMRFLSVHAEIVKLSRRNSNVRSLALSLGRKRTVIATCETRLQAFETALGRHAFTATR